MAPCREAIGRIRQVRVGELPPGRDVEVDEYLDIHDVAQLTPLDERPELQHRVVPPQILRLDQPAAQPIGVVEQRHHLVQRRRERFLADDVCARLEARSYELCVGSEAA